MHPAELLMRRRNVRAFINADPVDVVLIRPGEVTKTAAGGKVREPSHPLSPQRARIVPSKRRYNNGLINAEAGEIPDTQYLLIGLHDIDVQKDDTFEWLGSFYRITGIHPTRTESTLCSIDFDGARNET